MEIRKIEVKRDYDENPDFSYLGKFSDIKGDFAIEHGNNPRQYKYFNAENVENVKQAEQNYKRMMKYDSGELCDYGVFAVAEIVINGTIQKIRSGGLYGLSSDGTEKDFKEVEDDELGNLSLILLELGFKTSEIEDAIKRDLKKEKVLK